MAKQRTPKPVDGAPAFFTGEQVDQAFGTPPAKRQALVDAGVVIKVKIGHATVRYRFAEASE